MDNLSSIPEVAIDSGIFKYVLIKAHLQQDEKFLVRGSKSAEYHSDIFNELYDELKDQGIQLECCGGGKISHDPVNKKIKVYGYSQGFGQADHAKTVEILKRKYPDYEIEFSNDGY